MLTRLRELREKSGKTTENMANEVGISKGFYSMIENGDRRLNYDMAVKIAQVFNKEPDDIFLPTRSTNSKHLDEVKT